VTRIILLILALSLPLVVHPQQVKDRSITSEEFTKQRPKPKKPRPQNVRKYRLASDPQAKPIELSSPSTVKIGVTLWKVERAGEGRSTKEIARRVTTNTQFHEGDLIRLSIEAPLSGYLYVIDRDWFTGDSAGQTKLIFPLHGEDNRLEAGKLIDIPGQDDAPFKAQPGPGQTGEMLTIIVTRSPLSLSLSNKELPIPNAQVADWTKMWSGMTERFEMINGSGEVRTIEEQEATGTRQLTRDDPPPQTIYVLTPRSGDGLLFNLLLAYVR